MELSDYFRIVRQRGWLLVLLALLGAASGYVFSRLQTPIYKSSMKLTVQPARTDFGLTQSAKTLLLSYIQIIWTETNAAEVASRLKLDYEPGRIYGNTKMAEDAASFGIEIQVTDANGEVANDIARTWADLMIEYRNDENTKQRREDRVNIVRGDPPRYSQDRPRTSINTIAGGLLGAVLGVALMAALEALSAAYVRGRSDIERRMSIPVLASIPMESAK
jgi:capsular polysaccharide biosynthesis protein